MNRSDVIGGSAVALTEALPFVAGIPRVYLVSDAIDTNGRFLLYTLASQVLSNNTKGRVLWLGCCPLTEEQILQGLRKIGCDRSVLANNTSTQANNKEPKSLTIRSLCVELSHKMLLQDDNYQDINKVFMKEMMQFVDQWLLLEDNNKETGTPWIILDDVSTLANLVGEQLVYQFILQLNAKSHAGGDAVTTSSPGVILRCSNDQEDESLPVYSGASLKGHQAWFGAGGANNSTLQQQQAIHSEEPPWERSLVELADGVMDVLPLASGYTRELHGRIVLTEMPFGRGWRHNKEQSAAAAIRNTHSKKAYPAMQIVNYCITDQNPKIVAYIM